jgi:hypothetical protein
MKTSSNKKNVQSDDWVQIELNSGVLHNINMSLVEEVTFYPIIAGEPALAIFYPSGRELELRGEKATAAWNLINSVRASRLS